MKRIQLKLIPSIIVLSLLVIQSCNKDKITYTSGWQYQSDRQWIGPDYWANRLQDWQLKDGELICTNSNLSLRTLHLLTHQVSENYGQFEISLQMKLNPEASKMGNDGWAGILLGAGENMLDYRASSLIHHSPGTAGGIIVGVNELGQVIFLDNTQNREHIGSMQAIPELEVPDSILLKISVYPDEDSSYIITADAVDLLSRKSISHNNLTKVSPQRILGNIAIASNHVEKSLENYAYAFKSFSLSGDKLAYFPEHRFGPFMGVLYTLNKNILKLSAQIAPISDEDQSFVRMQYRREGALTWTEVDSVPIRKDAFLAPFRIENWDSRNSYEYRLSYSLKDPKNRKRTFYYSGLIEADPVDKNEITVGAFSCISHMEGSINGGNCSYPDRLWFPHTSFIESVKKQEADILFFTGDQIYEGRPTPPDFSSPENTELDYLYKWYIFLWSTGELSRNLPTVCIPDDHDVYHGNIWGDGGKAAPAAPADNVYPDYYEGLEGHWQQDQGGYKLRPETVNMIQATQTSHLPDPYDPTPVEQGIEVYYTTLNYGRISFAILEDRKWKSSPSVMLPEEQVVNGFSQKRYVYGRNLDNPDAKLLGDRQLNFLENWTGDWTDTDMKAVISQTIFANLSTYPNSFRTDAGTPGLPAPPPGMIPDNYKLAKDMDSNGWPQTGRNKALSTIRKGYAVMIAGDQHLGSLIKMGVERWDDAGYSFCVPAIGNLWPRRWFPQEPGIDHVEGEPAYTGKYYDGFYNRMDVLAVANPVETGKKPGALYNRAVGYGIVKFKKDSANIRFECWRRDADPENGDEGMFPGWPRTVNMMENNGRPIRTWLPPYKVTGLANNPVFQVIDEEDGSILYTVRVPENVYQPGVFSYGGEFTVKIGDPDTGVIKTFEHIKARYNKPEDIIEVAF